MAVTQLVLTGVPAFVGAVTGPTTAKFFIDQNDFNPNNLIEVDLARNTLLAPATWATGVDVDHQMSGGYTTIGPRFHHPAKHVGAVYLAQRLVTQYAAVLASWPPAPDAIFQYQAVLRADNGTVRRYHGFKVQVMRPAVGSLLQLAFIPTGMATPAPDGPLQWIDVADSTICDPRSNGFTTIDATTPVGTVGALFLSSTEIGRASPFISKIPPGFGW